MQQAGPSSSPALGQRRRLAAYAVAVIATVLLLGVRLGLNDVLHTRGSYVLFFLGILLSAWIGGFGPGSVATLLSGAISWCVFVTPPGSFAPRSLAECVIAALYVVIGVSMSVVCERMHRAAEEAGARAAALSESEARARRSERILQAAAEAMERAAIEREALLESERAARADAERANRMKDEFLAVISHELRTPLSAILGWTTLLRRPGRTADQIEKGLAVLERNTRLQVQLISDLLDVSRIVTGKFNLEMQPVTPSTVVEAAVEVLRAAAAAKGVELSTAIAPSEGTVRGDPARLQQIVTNLIANAIKFTPPGGRVSVSLAEREDRAEITVADTGQGISAEFLPHVFDRFRQADASTTRRHGGLGLGLAIVKHLVESHGGAVRAESAGAGLGATFTVTLPCAEGRVSATAAPPIPSEPASLRGVRVLVLDDERDTRELVQRLLEEHEAEVDAAASAEQALALLKSHAPDVIVSDIGMPGMDGYALMREVRREGAEKASEVPAVALTAFARAEDRQRALSAGYQAHLAKPIEPAELVATVASLAAARAATAA
ncbi:MAG: ATP-binding protein [Minicystis sp.]